jgi:hypothetical protein
MAAPLRPFNVLTAILASALPITLASPLREPKRRQLLSILTAWGAGLYLNSGFGAFELCFAVVVLYLAYMGLPVAGGDRGGKGGALEGYSALGTAWVLHALWDAAHHANGYPLLSYIPTSAAECVITDVIVAGWLLGGATSVFGM